MEASVAGAGPAGVQADAGEGAAAQQGGDLSQYEERLQSLSTGQEELRQFLQSNPVLNPQEPEAQQEAFTPDLSFLDQADQMDPATFNQHLTDVISQTADARVQEALKQELGPMRDEMAQQRLQADAERLVSEFPQMADPAVANQVFNTNKQWAEANFPGDIAAKLIASPQMWRHTFLAGRAMEAMQQEAGGESPAGHMEGGGGAIPSGGQQDLGALIKGDGRGGRSVLPF